MIKSFLKRLTIIVSIFIILTVTGNNVNAEEWTELQSKTRISLDDGEFNYYPIMKTDIENNIHIVYEDYRTTGELYYQKKNSTGNTIIGETLITGDDGATSITPMVDIDNVGTVNIVYMVGTTPDIYYRKLDNNGMLIRTVRISNTPDWSCFPSIAMDGMNSAHIVWCDNVNGNYNLHYAKINSAGTILVNKVLVNTAECQQCDIMVDGANNICVNFVNYNGSYHEVRYVKADNNGNVIVPNKIISLTTANAFQLSSDIDGLNNVHVVYTAEYDVNREIYYSKINSEGNIVVSNSRITVDESESANPDLDVDVSGRINIVWNDHRDGVFEIYYSKLDNNGIMLLGNTKITNSGTFCIMPKIETDLNEKMYISFVEEINYNGELWYVSGKVESAVIEEPVEEQLEDLIEEGQGIQAIPDSSFDANPNSVTGRKTALTGMIEDALVFLNEEPPDYQSAIDQLEVIQAKCDGDSSPKDWIIGSDAVTLYNELQTIIDQLIALMNE